MKRALLLIALLTTFFSGMAQTMKFRNVSEKQLPEISRTQRNSMDAKVGDIDADGDLDIVVAVEFVKNIVLINNGKGVFNDESYRLPNLESKKKTKPYPYYPYHDTEDIALRDFDNDGDLDLIFVTEDDKVNEFYLNDGKGFFVDKTATFPVDGVSNGVLAEDFDGDGWVDVIVGNNGQNYYLKNAKGKFVDETIERLPKVGDITQDLQSVDFDGDGDLDVIIANEKSNRLLFNDGKGVFEDKTDIYFDQSVLNEETREATFVDIDKDGDFDMYFANVYMFQQVEPVQRLLVNQGMDKKFTDETKTRLGFTNEYSIIDASFADFDGDNAQDLLLLTHVGPKLFQNDGNGFFEDITEATIGEIKVDGVDAEIADFNSDGLLDIFISCFRAGDVLLVQGTK